MYGSALSALRFATLPFAFSIEVGSGIAPREAWRFVPNKCMFVRGVVVAESDRLDLLVVQYRLVDHAQELEQGAIGEIYL